MTTGSVFSVQQETRIAEIVRKELVPTHTKVVILEEEIKEVKNQMLTKDEFYTAMDRYAERLEAASQEAKMNFGISMRHEEAIEKLKAILARDGIDIQKIKLHLRLQ